MNYETSEPETKEHHRSCKYKTGIVIAGGHPSILQALTEQIIKAVRYIQSLLKSKIFGFTILVKTERSGEK